MVGKLANSALTRMPSVQERRRFAKEMPKNTGTKGVSFEETPSIQGKLSDCTFFWARCPFLQALTGLVDARCVPPRMVRTDAPQPGRLSTLKGAKRTFTPCDD